MAGQRWSEGVCESCKVAMLMSMEEHQMMRPVKLALSQKWQVAAKLCRNYFVQTGRCTSSHHAREKTCDHVKIAEGR